VVFKTKMNAKVNCGQLFNWHTVNALQHRITVTAGKFSWLLHFSCVSA